MHYNIVADLAKVATTTPEKCAVHIAKDARKDGSAGSDSYSFGELYDLCTRYSQGLLDSGIEPHMRVLVMAKPSIDFLALIFAINKIGAVPVLIDPGMGLKRMLICIQEAEPAAMLALPILHIIKRCFPKYFKSVKVSISTGARLFPSVKTLADINHAPTTVKIHPSKANDLGAIFFTSGSTGIPKGVESLRKHLIAQRDGWNDALANQENDIEVTTFAIFLLISIASGRTCIVPDMNFSKPAKVNPKHIVHLVQKYKATLCFGSPALWDRVSRYCETQGITLPSLRQAITAGAPVGNRLCAHLDAILPNGVAHILYGATEALPVSTVTSNHLLPDKADKTSSGAGVCVGQPFSGVELKILKITDETISCWDDELVLPTNTVGEIVVSGKNVTQTYFRREKETELSKIFQHQPDNTVTIWHRMGDVGYLDDEGNLWFCGRKRHCAFDGETPYYSLQVEGVFNSMEGVLRTALVNVESKNALELAIAVEPDTHMNKEVDLKGIKANILERSKLFNIPIKHILLHDKPFPVDRRHNSKIEREKITVWANKKIVG